MTTVEQIVRKMILKREIVGAVETYTEEAERQTRPPEPLKKRRLS